MFENLSGIELFIRFTARAFRKLLSIYVFCYYPLGFEGRIWDLMVSVLIIACLFTLHVTDSLSTFVFVFTAQSTTRSCRAGQLIVTLPGQA